MPPAAQSPSSASTKATGSKATRSSTLLPDAHEAHGDPELALHREHDAASRGPVELGEDDPGHPDGVGELARLGDRVLPGRRVEDQEHLCDLTRRAVRDAPHLLQLLEQTRLVVQPARGVGEDEGDALRGRPVQRVVDDRAGVRALVGADEVTAHPRRPRLELIRRRGAERVAGGEEDRAAPWTPPRRPCRSSSSCRRRSRRRTATPPRGRRSTVADSGAGAGPRTESSSRRSAPVTPSSPKVRSAAAVRSASRIDAVVTVPTSARSRASSTSASSSAPSVERPRRARTRSKSDRADESRVARGAG